MAEWIRIPVAITDEKDRRELCAILTANGLECRIVRLKATNRGTPKRYIEYRDTGLTEAQIFTSDDGKKSAVG